MNDPTDSIVYSYPRGVKDSLPSDDKIFGLYKNEIEKGKEMITFTSTGPKSYFCEIGEVIIEKDENGKKIFKPTITDVIARSKGFTLKHQSAKGLVTKNLMRGFLEAVARNEEKKLVIPQYRFEISKHTYDISPKHYEKLYRNKNLLLKRLYNPKVSISQTYPIGAVKFYK